MGSPQPGRESQKVSFGSWLPCALSRFAHTYSLPSHGVWMPAREHSSTFPTNRPDMMLYSNPPEDSGAVFLKPVAASIVRQQHPALSEADKRQICSTPYVAPKPPTPLRDALSKARSL